MARYAILGPVKLCDGDRLAAAGGPRQVALLAFLLIHANRAVSADRLLDALWSEQQSRGSLKSLQMAIARLRRTLAAEGTPGESPLLTVAGGYSLTVHPGELDADAFEARMREGRAALDAGDPERASEQLREALGLWRGPALADVAYQEFAQAEIRRLEELRLGALEVRNDAELQRGRHATLVGELRALAVAHTTRERLVEQLMLALYRCGRQSEALDVYQRTRTHLAAELGLEPGATLRALQAQILAQSPELDLRPPRTQPSSEPFARPAGYLPVPATELLARVADLDALEALIGKVGSRVVTLIGPGGVGKTRLAIEAARRLDANFTDGARFVSLVSVGEPRELPAALARALAAPVREGEPPTAALHRFLGDRSLLLVLDNFEHLVASAPLVGELLAASPGLTILVTSREPTRLAAERLYPVRPLAVPGASERRIEGYGAVALFVDRVRARDPGFVLDQTNAAAVCEICRRLDGLPLAIELAAARVGLLSPTELTARLDQALTVLGAGPCDAPERHRTLRAAIDWSFGLLTPVERDAFTKLAVFAAAATVPASEYVTGASLDTLDSLVAKQLLLRRGERLAMLETVREYALERLSEHPGRQAVRTRLAAWCLDFARGAAPHIGRADQVAWVALLDAELPNLLAALSHALGDGHEELALELVANLGPYWLRTGQSDEGVRWIDAAVTRCAGGPARLRANALLWRARVAGIRSGEGREDDLRAALELFRRCDDNAGIARCLCELANTEAWHDRCESASALSDEAMAFAQLAEDEETTATVLKVQALVQSNYRDMSPRARTALAHLRRVGMLGDAGGLCVSTSYVALFERRYRDAIAWLTDGREIAGTVENAELLFLVVTNEGLARLFVDEIDEAAVAFAEALAVCRDAACEGEVLEPLLGLAAIAARRGRHEHAARLAGAATRHRPPLLAPIETEIEARLWNEILPGARESYGPERWDRATADGGSLTVHEAIDLGLERGLLAAP